MMFSFKSKQRRSVIFIWFVACSGIFLSLTAFVAVRNRDRQKLQADFAHAVENRFAALKREIESNVDVLSSLQAFFLHSNIVTRAEFQGFTKNLSLKHPGIQALVWIPRIPNAQRSAYETAAVRDGCSDFRITEQSAQGKMARAGERKEYFPVYYVEPYQNNLGYDLASDPLHKEVLNRSCDAGGPAVATHTTFVQERVQQNVFLVFSPVYKNLGAIESIQVRRRHLKGFALGAFRIGDLVERSLSYLKPEEVDIYLYDEAVPGKNPLLYFHPSDPRRKTDSLSAAAQVPDDSLKIIRTIQLPGRTWQIMFVAAPAYVGHRKTWQPLGVLLGGLLLTALLSAFLIAERRRLVEIAGSNELLLQEIDAHKKTEGELRFNEELFKRIFEEGPVGMVLADPHNRIVMANKVFCELLGYREEELIGRHPDDVTYEEDRLTSEELSTRMLQGGIPKFRSEKRYVRKDGNILWAYLTTTGIHGKDGQALYGLGIIEDLTDLKKATEKIYRLAYYDILTGLPNRTFFKELLERTIEHAKRYKETFAVIYVELDNFKRINDSLGHHIGDSVLKTVADRISGSLRSSDYIARSHDNDPMKLIYRVGGDEFIVLAQNLMQAQDIAKTADRLLRDIAAPLHSGDQEIFITASIGISLYPEDATDVDNLMQNADAAMGYAKHKGKNNFQFYSKSINSTILEQMLLENDLRKALERNEFILHYQPRVDAVTLAVTGMEALLRWQHPDKGIVMPMLFIPQAEASGLIVPIGEQVMHIMSADLKKWQEAGCPQVNMAINVSSRQFDQENLAGNLSGLLRDTVLPPQCLELEITESTIMRSPEEAIRTLQEIKAMGVRIVIDDFGIGYSSLRYLQRLPLDYLKIDKSFVDHLAANIHDQAIVRAIIAMAHSLNLKVIAEGVETEEQLAFLREHGCDEIQGFLFSRPLPVERIPAILANGRLQPSHL